jgi:hypothetical protein
VTDPKARVAGVEEPMGGLHLLNVGGVQANEYSQRDYLRS